MSSGVAEVSSKYLAQAVSDSIPDGYKKTEVGVIPEDWEVATIAEKHNLATGSTPPTSNLKNYGETYFFVSPADLSDKKYILQTEKKLSEQGFKISRKYPAGSTLFTCIGSTIGKTGLAPVELTSNQQINAIFPNGDSDAEFTYYAVTYIAPKVKALAGQQAVPLVNKTEFGETLFCFPRAKHEQTAIANALSDVDALISELEKLIAKKQAIKTATMQQLLTGRTRLPLFALREDGTPKGTKPSELGEIPEDWEVVTLGTASSFINGRAYSLHEWENSGTPVIRLQNLTGRGDEYYYSNLQLPEKQYCKSGDLLFMWSATFGPVIWRGPKAIYHYHIWKIACEVGYGQSYLFYLLDDMTEKLKRSSSSGGTMLHVTKEKMESTKAAFPSYEEQTAIATILSDMDAEIQALEQRLGKTRQIKQGMMQELLTGKTRLVQPSLTGVCHAD